MENEALYFKNFSQDSFTYKYDGKDYTFKPGDGVWLPTFKAKHFAKHLVDREMQKDGLLVDDACRDSYMSKAISGQVTESNNNLNSEELALNKNKENIVDTDERKRLIEECKNKGIIVDGRWNIEKLRNALNEKSEEENFEGLK